MKNLFNSIQLMKPKKNVFDLSHDVKLSTKMGQLTPIMLQECVPGDKFKIGCESLIRFAPLVAPVMHRMDVTMHYFFVPNRIIWRNWEAFITNNGPTGTGPTVVAPFIYSAYFEDRYASQSGTAQVLADYLGLPKPPDNSENTKISALPFAAYQAVYDQYYRDQNLVTSIDYELTDGDNSPSFERVQELCSLRNRAWEHDYFTAALPFAQKGDAVTIPLGSVELNPDWSDQIPTVGAPVFRNQAMGVEDGGVFMENSVAEIQIPGGVAGANAYDPRGTLEVEPTTINDLRRAFRLQEWLEKAARGGSRYFESILSFFGLRSPDSRLQRPEYITGTKSPVQVSEVLNTTGTDEAPQGTMAGHGVSVTQGKYGHYTCQEHGYIIGIMSVMPKTAYQDGLHRMWSKTIDPFQYYFPQFDHIGEQEVLNKEVYLESATPNGTFGYVPRYAEYKFLNSRVAGDFRNTLDFWHMGRKFSTEPALNSDFITCDPTHRIFAVTDPAEQKLWCHIYHSVKAIRPMSKFSTPTF